ncbi:hypothetical protein [Nodosilinea sp. E11]|uniref:hypothetical protein n=1 Tax=Nodosilinea sp. E11 TaxID=3037479 RepID=UPI002934674E|nr:hypothetical protein [Nodosilinea sp. E11]WOD40858.1 hypothetical protein RRF56_08625 [Nodosilinea sp. E11]
MNQSSQPSNPASKSAMAAEHDLLASILTADEAYPWQPLAPEAEAYLTHLEAEFDDLGTEDLTSAIAAGWQILAAQMSAQRGETAIAPAQARTVFSQIRQFQARVPNELLQSLATTATALARSGQPLIDQLVQCANDILPSWDTADLAVLARPLAYSLRDGRGEILELNLRAIPANPWETLSDLEQARLTLAIASVALKAAQADDDGAKSDRP